MDVAQLSGKLRELINRHVSKGHVADEEQFLEQAVLRFSAELDAEDEIVAIAEAGIADIESGRFTTVSTPEDAEILHERAMARLRARLAEKR